MTDLVFVVGSLHSGANWAYELLAGHPEVTGVRDTWALYDERQTVARVRAAGEAAFAGADGAVVAVKSVPHVFMIRELAEAWPEARFVHVLRDGRDAVVRVRIGRFKLDARTAGLYGTSISLAAAGWARATDAGLDAEAMLEDRIRTIRFEDVIRDRERAAAEIFSFCGLPSDDRLVHDILERGDGRLRAPEPVGAWRAYFSVYRALRFERAAGRTLRRAGYERDPKWWWRPIKR